MYIFFAEIWCTVSAYRARDQSRKEFSKCAFCHAKYTVERPLLCACQLCMLLCSTVYVAGFNCVFWPCQTYPGNPLSQLNVWHKTSDLRNGGSVKWVGVATTCKLEKSPRLYQTHSIRHTSLSDTRLIFVRLFLPKRALFLQGVWSARDPTLCINAYELVPQHVYGVATRSRLLKIIGLSCKRALQKRLYSAKPTYTFKEPTNRSHPIGELKCYLSAPSQTSHFSQMRHKL